MQLRRKIVTAVLSVTCAAALAACGQQVAAHVQAGDSVHSALTSVFDSPTTRFVVTAEGLPGVAALADGSFSVVITTAKDASSKAAGMEVSVLHETTDLADILAVSGSTYLRVDLKDIASLSGNPAEFATISGAVAQVAARPNLGYLNDIVAGKWVGITATTYQAIVQKYMKMLSGSPSRALSGLPSSAVVPQYVKNLEKLLKNPQKLKALSLTVRSSFVQSVQTWLSIHQKAAGEYSMSLPVRSFVSSLLNKLVKPLESYLGAGASVSKAQLSQATASIPSALSLQANLWVSNGSLTKVQAFIPRSNAYLMIDVSHPTAPLAPPSGATMLTVDNLTALSGLSAMAGGLGSSLGGMSAMSSISSAL
jgi:hypothetical protein